MSQAYVNLTYFFDKCITNEEYKIKNKKNLLNCPKLVKLENAIKYRENIDNYSYDDSYKEIVDKLCEQIKFTNGKWKLNEVFLSYSIDKIFKEIGLLNNNIKTINEALEKTKEEINKFKRSKDERVEKEYFIEKELIKEFNNIILERTQELYFNNYNREEINSLLKGIDSQKLVENREKLIDIYNHSLTLESHGDELINSLGINYDESKELYRHRRTKKFYTNLTKKNILTEGKINKVIDYYNYKEYLNVECEASLIKDSFFNIELLFKDYINNENYLVAVEAYFSALQDLKEFRGKKYCWICGKKLDLFYFRVTCKEHLEYEEEL